MLRKAPSPHREHDFILSEVQEIETKVREIEPSTEASIDETPMGLDAIACCCFVVDLCSSG